VPNPVPAIRIHVRNTAPSRWTNDGLDWDENSKIKLEKTFLFMKIRNSKMSFWGPKKSMYIDRNVFSICVDMDAKKSFEHVDLPK
jgi:hypothetical protein